jgi:polyisoprenoid-binding protein YceI
MVHVLLGLLLAIDPGHSKAQFSVAHIFVEHVTGLVPIESGTVDVPDGSAIPTMVKATLDARGVKTDDPDRDVALRGPEFFDVSRYPAWTFVSTQISPAGKGFRMRGNLTVHGVTQSETLVVTVGGTPSCPVYHATGTIDRHAFGMAKSRLDAVIGNPIEIDLDIVLKS